MATPIVKNRKRCIPIQRTTEEKILALRKELGLNLKEEKKNETLRFNLRAIKAQRFDWCRPIQ